MKHYLRIILSGILALQVTDSFAAYTEPKSYLKPGCTIEVDPTEAVDDSAVFQQAIDEVHAAGGGQVVVSPGEYQVMNIRMKSDVHLIFKGASTIRPYLKSAKNGGGNLFSFGMDGAIANASIIGLGDPIVFDFTKCDPKVGLRVVLIGECDNFRVANITINDNQTVFSSVTLTWCGVKDGVAQVPRNGLIENITANDADYGYGAIQAHSGEHITFRNIKSVGGVAVRLETGYAKMNKAGIGGLFDITAEDVMSVNGQAALFFEPHTMRHGDVVARNIQSDGSEFAVYLGGDFVSKKKFGANSSLTAGGFRSIHIDGVRAVYRDGPNVTRYGNLKYIPKELHDLVYPVQDKRNPYRGPSIAAVGNMKPEAKNVVLKNIEAVGFKYRPEIITPADANKGGVKHLTQKEPRPLSDPSKSSKE